MTHIELFLFGSVGFIFLILLLLIGVWSSMDDKPRTPMKPISEESEIRKYLLGKMREGGRNVQKEKKEKDPKSAQGSPRADD